jgi:hypothetical protein
MGIFFKNIKCADPKRPCRQDFFLKLINMQGKYQYTCRKINMQGDFFLKKNKRADQNKALQRGIFSQN